MENTAAKDASLPLASLGETHSSAQATGVVRDEGSPGHHNDRGHHDHGHHGHGHHGHGPLDKQKALTIGSLSFQPVFNDKFNEDRVQTVSCGFLFLTRFLPLIIGLITAFCAVIVSLVSETIGEWRCTVVRQLIIQHGWVSAWLAGTGIMMACALLGGFPVYCGRSTKTGGSSGIPQLIGLLNGCDLRSDFTWKHLLTKWWGVSFAVASGLAVGPEGPMIFIGCLVGGLCAKLPQSTFLHRYIGAPPATMPADVYLRDYVSIGAGCGIAAAFRAPIAGTLFIVEEAASHFKKEDMARIFFGGLASLEVILLTGGFASVLEYKVWVGSPTCSATPWWSIVFFLILGCVCGVAGAAFNWINIKVMTYRASYANATMRGRRVLEILILCLLSSSAWLAAAACFGEQTTSPENVFASSDGCVRDSWLNQVMTGSVIERAKEGRYTQKFLPSGCLYGVQVNPTLCQQAWDNATSTDPDPYVKQCIDSVKFPNILALDTKKTSYCCAFDSMDELKSGHFFLPGKTGCSLDLGEGLPSLEEDAGNDREQGRLDEDQEQRSWHQMASLTLVPFKVACQNLFARGVPNLLSFWPVLIFFLLFSLAAAVTAGCAIPSGLLMPQMIIGACIGRGLSLVIIQFQHWFHDYPKDSEFSFMWSSAYKPFFGSGGPLSEHSLFMPSTTGYLDPGIAAVVGAAALLGGSGRVTLFTTVMMVEITGDPVMIFPVGFATVFAVLVGNTFNHGLYHSLLDVQSQPYLPDTWQSDELPPGIRVKDMMPRNDPIVIPLNGGKEGIRDAITGNKYTGFPLVEDDGAVLGIVSRQPLEELLEQEGPVLAEDLKHVCFLHPLTVREDFPLQMAYLLFKAMDMNNLIVVDVHHRPLAVMTRFAFLAWRVKERLGSTLDALLHKEESRRSRRRAGSGGLPSPRRTGFSWLSVSQASEPRPSSQSTE